MRIFSFSDPKYFKYLNSLVRSIRYSENENHIHLLLLDFNKRQQDAVLNGFKNDSKIHFDFIESINTYGKPIKNKTNFYRNCRPRYFLKLLKEYPSDNLLTFGANGIVFKNLNFIEKQLDKNDFVFLERTKKTPDGKIIKNIGQFVDYLDTRDMDISDMFENSWPGKLVLLGTHGIQNNNKTRSVIESWKNYIEESDNINQWFSDMSYFVRAYVEYEKKHDYTFKKSTGWNLPREENPYVDTLLGEGTNIWFAKGPAKFNNKKYLKMVDKFKDFEYNL